MLNLPLISKKETGTVIIVNTIILPAEISAISVMKKNNNKLKKGSKMTGLAKNVIVKISLKDNNVSTAMDPEVLTKKIRN